jgi:hypothetical protein
MGITQQIGASSLIKPGVIDNTAARPASPYEGQMVYEKDTDKVLVYNGTAWIFPNSSAVAIFQDQRSSGTSHGNLTAGAWTKRTLNTTVINNVTGCSIASSVITLPAGSYLISANATFYRTNLFQLRLRNTTAGTTLQTGLNGYADTDDGNGDVQNGLLNGYITLTGSTNLELQYYADINFNSNSGGVATSYGTEVYASLTIQQVS